MAINGNFQFRRGTAALWSSTNPILLSGELGLETDTKFFKIGDGTTPWNMLPYGGIQGTPGEASQTIVGATTVINPNQNPSVTDADAGPNADLRFSLPRAREISVVQTNTVSPGTAASVSTAADAEGDVNLTFNIPRGASGWSPVLSVVTDGERRVLRLVNYVGGEGTAPTIPTDNYIGATGLTNLANAVDIRGAVGATGPAANSFTNIAVTGQNTVVADQANDTLTLVAGANITLTTNDATDSITISSTSVATNAFGVVTGNTGTATADLPTDTLAITGGTGISTAATDTPDGLVITNTDTGSAARTAHEAAADPHPQYTTTAEAAAAAPVQSVNGQTGNVTVAAGTNNNATTRTAPTASASTAVTTIASLPIAAGEIVAGSEYEFFASLRVINTTTATNSVVTVSVGATNVLVLTQANGTTAAAAPGAPVQIYGRITFYSATQAECVIHFAKSQAVAANVILNTSAPITVAAATATTIDLKYNTSGTTATFIARQATIQRIK